MGPTRKSGCGAGCFAFFQAPAAKVEQPAQDTAPLPTVLVEAAHAAKVDDGRVAHQKESVRSREPGLKKGFLLGKQAGAVKKGAEATIPSSSPAAPEASAPVPLPGAVPEVVAAESEVTAPALLSTVAGHVEADPVATLSAPEPTPEAVAMAEAEPVAAQLSSSPETETAVVGTADVTDPAASEAAPETGGNAPDASESARTVSAAAPDAELSAPAANATLPDASVTAVAAKETAPAASEAAPAASENAADASHGARNLSAAAPDAELSAPAANATVPDTSVTAVAAKDAAPAASEAAPEASDTRRDVNVAVLDANATMPDADASVPDANGMLPATTASPECDASPDAETPTVANGHGGGEIPEEAPPATADAAAVDAAAPDAGIWKDVSPAQDGSLRKYVISESTVSLEEEGVTPTDGARVEIEFAWRPILEEHEDSMPDPTEGWAFTSGVAPQRIGFVLGDCDRCDALESALASMKRGETCVVRCGVGGAGKVSDWTDEHIGLIPRAAGGPVAAVDMLLSLLQCEKEKDVMEMEPEDRVKYAAGRKDAAAKYFKAERYLSALNKYRLVLDVVEYVQDIKDPRKLDEATTMRKAAKLNEAACHLKLSDWAGAVKACSDVLKDVPRNEKALYRRATAYMKLGEHYMAETDLRRCLEVNADNQEARRLLANCKAIAKESGSQQKDVYAKMLKGARAPRRR